MGISYEVHGVEETRKAVRQMQRDLETQARLASNSSATDAASAIRMEAPKVTGFLAQSTGATGDQVEIKAVYGGPQNYGWRVKGLRAQHFVGRALARIAAARLKRYDDAAKEAIKGAGLE